MNILVKAYASVGDVEGAMKVLARIGSAVRTCEVNSALAAALKSPKMDHWDTIVKMLQEYFSSERLIADNETYETFILLCEKYKRPDDALVWFEDFVSQGNTVTDAITRAFGAAVDEATFKEHVKRNFYDQENLNDTLVNYRQLLASTPASESAKGFAPAFVGNTTEVYNLLQSRIKAPTDSTELRILVEKHISLGDLQSARQVISIAAAEANYPDSATIFSLMQGYASHGDHVLAESLFEDSRLHGTTNQGTYVHDIAHHVM